MSADPDLLHRITSADIGPRGEAVGKILGIEDDEIDTLPIPLPGAPVLLSFEEPPPLYLKAYKRALVVLTKVCARRKNPPNRETRRAMAQVTAEYCLWDLASRSERRNKGWPKNKADFTRERGLTERGLDTAIDLTRYKSWKKRYEVDHGSERLRNVDDILYSKIEESADLPPGKLNAKLFDTYYRRHGQISPREGAKSVTVNVSTTAEERDRLIERIQTALPYAKGEHDGFRTGDSAATDPGEPRGEAAPLPAGLEEGEPGGLREEA